MNKKMIISATSSTMNKLKALAGKKASAKTKMMVTAKKLGPKAKKVAVKAEKGSAIYKNKKTVTSAIDNTILKLKVLPNKKEGARRKLVVIAKRLVSKAKKKENIRGKLVVTAKQLAVTAKKIGFANKYARSLIEASLDPLVTISPGGKITDVNKATIKVTGVSREKLIGTDFSNYFTEPKKALAGYKQVFREGSVTDYPLTIRSKKGKHTDVLYNASVYKDAKGNVLGVFAAARDVTDAEKAKGLLAVTAKEKESVRRKLAVTAKEKESVRNKLVVTAKQLAVTATETKRINEELRTLDIAKDEFVSIASHQLRTPPYRFKGLRRDAARWRCRGDQR